jgi:hypothetical protein
MKNISEIRFVKELKDCYFHRDRKYENNDIKQKALEAMLMLWNADNVECCGYIYSQDMIRNMMLNKMMPEELDDAIKCWKEHGETSVEQLYHHLFLTVVLANALELFHKVMRCECIPIECEIKVRVVA